MSALSAGCLRYIGPLVLLLALAVPAQLSAASFHMTNFQSVNLGAAGPYIYHQVLDVDGDSYEDVAVLYADRLVVYSFAQSDIIWEISGSNLVGFVIGDIDGTPPLDAVLFTSAGQFNAATYPSATADSVGYLTAYTLDYPPNTPAHMTLRDLGHDGSIDLIVSRIRRSVGLICMSGIGETDSRFDIWTFSLPDFEQSQYYQQIGDGLRRSDDLLAPGDIDGDGLDELVTTGLQVVADCETDSWGSPYTPVTRQGYDLNVYNQLGQRLRYGAVSRWASVATFDLDPDRAGEETVVRSSGYVGGDFGHPANTDQCLFSFKISNGTIQRLWTRDVEAYEWQLLILPGLPHTIGLPSRHDWTWTLFNGRTGAPAHTIYGLSVSRFTFGGHLHPAADTGLLIAQLSGTYLALFGRGLPTAIDNNQEGTLPEAFALYPNYPNPFNPTTEIAFSLPAAGNVRLEIYNIAGQKVATPLHDYLSAGEHIVLWDASGFASGVYLYRLTMGEFSQARKMMLLK